ncbi:hypothetical protein ZIOFF_046887 [Zingiber officinale]|uniref:non-specific serine/threonine protein kinase n=1 Tax=Zingiber officinale TaxID=94328 RepID=A0A8J5FW97_ZINOF|nr:hypothetical protein ZIOFF_046887 [Zingiber officinale]
MSFVGIIIVVVVIAMVVLVACSVGLLLHHLKKKSNKKFELNIESINAYFNEPQSLHMSIQALKTTTNNFSVDFILRKGGFGIVYKGDLSVTLTVVKRSISGLMGQNDQQEFETEIDVLRKGTLGHPLFEWESRNAPPLTWKQRLVISLDIARCIEYLHSFAQEIFIHRDMKPTNILLDKDLNAKVSDFGLVKLATNNKISMTTRVAGTFGYLAPEYARKWIVDVYAFGVILMEIITGRKVLAESFLPDDNLVSVFRREFTQEKNKILNSMADRVLELDDETQKGLMEVANLDWHCTCREPYQRPDMSHIVNTLSPLIEPWQPPTTNDIDNRNDSTHILTEILERWRMMAETRNCIPYAAFVFFFLVYLLVIDLCYQCRGENPDDTTMYELTRSLYGVPSNWKPQLDPCSWDDLICSHDRVIAINLAQSGISGSLSPAHGNLTSLTSLQLEFNNICGSLPRLTKLSLLQQIYLQANAFDSIPSGFFIKLSSL